MPLNIIFPIAVCACTLDF